MFLNLPKYKRSILVQFRLGILPLNIETVWYKNITDDKGQIRKQKPEEITCKLYSLGVTEDEFPFLFGSECYIFNIYLFIASIGELLNNISIYKTLYTHN